ncbi:hypothetical protein JCM3765_001834 [Sporobolomyces pararoseus]
MTSYASATAAWTPPKLEAHPDPSLLTTSTDSDSTIKSTKDALEYTPPLTPPISTEDQDKLSDNKKNVEEQGEEIPGSVFDHVIPGVKVMETRQLPDDLEKKIAKPYMARANIAASVEEPNGTLKGDWAKKHKNQSVLAQHVDFFLRPEADGILWPLDTWRGFRKMGYSFFWCTFAMTVIHVFFTWFTSSNKILFDPLLRVNTNNGHRAKHGSDTGVIDTEGRFVPAKFEEIFAKFDEDKKGGLTFTEGVKMVHALRTACDPIGWGAAIFEWASTYLLVWPQDGIVDKESIRCVFDGSIFYVVARLERHRAKEHALKRKQMTWLQWIGDSIPGPWRVFTRGWKKENKAGNTEMIWKFD